MFNVKKCNDICQTLPGLLSLLFLIVISPPHYSLFYSLVKSPHNQSSDYFFHANSFDKNIFVVAFL